uniref:RNA polymerase II subunit B1 CTD phosphatase RPAP2 homolog n=1 Tax=Oryzias latipes TaxID=8090 RepID=H2LK07_ORYLA
RSKTLTAEEEARRRFGRKDALREQLELERRALEVVEQLLESSVAEDFLLESAKFITPANYRDAVEERSILKLCGYPTCPKQLGKIPSQQFKISTKTNRVYDITERKRFCSNFCYKASKEFELQIPKTPLWLRKLERSQVEIVLVCSSQQNLKEPVLPLVDSQAQHLIQKRITVEKLSSCLRTIVGPLHLTLSDVSTDLNDLVKTFRFTNTNIVHKSPEWTLIAVVLLHVLSTVSPVVRGALEADSSVDYVKTLLKELGLEEQHLLSLVELNVPAQT